MLCQNVYAVCHLQKKIKIVGQLKYLCQNKFVPSFRTTNTLRTRTWRPNMFKMLRISNYENNGNAKFRNFLKKNLINKI